MFKRGLFLIAGFLAVLSAQTPGEYKGTWVSGSSGSGGKLTLTFSSDGLSASSFTLQGQEVKAKAISTKGTKETVEFIFEYDVGGTILRSRMQGAIDGKSLKGKYQSLTADGGSPVDEGTWEVTQQ